MKISSYFLIVSALLFGSCSRSDDVAPATSSETRPIEEKASVVNGDNAPAEKKSKKHTDDENKSADDSSNGQDTEIFDEPADHLLDFRSQMGQVELAVHELEKNFFINELNVGHGLKAQALCYTLGEMHAIGTLAKKTLESNGYEGRSLRRLKRFLRKTDQKDRLCQNDRGTKLQRLLASLISFTPRRSGYLERSGNLITAIRLGR